MSINEIIMFSEKENIYLNNNEYENIYNFVKKNGYDLITNQKKVYEFLYDNFDADKRDKIYNLFLKYQKKYSSYL